MVVFAVEWENKRADEYMRSVKERMSWSNITGFSSMGRLFLRGNVAQTKGMYVVEVEPLLPRIYFLPPVFSLGLFIFGVTTPWLHVPLLLLTVAGYVLWTPSFHFWALKRGYAAMMQEEPVVRRLSNEDAMRRVLGWDR